MLRRALIAALVLAVAVALAPFALASAGTWLVVQDPIRPSRAVVVFGGQLPFRAMEAASIYKQHHATEVWLTKGQTEEDDALARLGIEKPGEHVYSQKVLEHLGVPRDAIRVLSESVDDTADEVRVVAQALKVAGGTRVILVTSKYHTRRVRYMWRRMVGSRPEAIVRYAPGDPYDQTRWWHNTQDSMAVAREWFGLLNAVAGFPMKSTR